MKLKPNYTPINSTTPAFYNEFKWPKTDTAIIDKTDLFTALAKINDISKWKKNWDGYNAPRPKKLAINNALSIVKLIHDFSQLLSMNWKPVFITANCEGGVVFEWHYRNRNLTFYISQQSIYFLKIEKDKIELIEEGEVEKLDLSLYKSLFTWLNYHD